MLDWIAVAAFVGLVVWMFSMRGRVRAGRGHGEPRDDKNQDQFPRTDLNANINPSQLGNKTDLWPDRTGAHTRRELGARHAVNVTYAGDREEGGAAAHGRAPADSGRESPTAGATPPRGETPTGGTTPPRTAEATPETGPVGVPGREGPGTYVRREVKPGPHEHGPGANAAADLAPEDEFGEDRPAARTEAPDQPPTQWHPEEHGAPGDHYRDGHHRSGTGPERKTSTKDPYAHAPVPGPNHMLPETGRELPPDGQP